MRGERRGFTLIELLVVIAIIAILAAMLFPVFARARESARKIQCLANVKNIATAVQMYLTDYDRLWPDEHNQEAMTAVAGWISSDMGCGWPEYRAYWANPFLRPQVILDEYTRNREVWKCPSAKWDTSMFWIVPNYGRGYLDYLRVTHDAGMWAVSWHVQNDPPGPVPGGDPCSWAFPPGWGGAVTDSIGQQAGYSTPEKGGFVCTIGTSGEANDLKTSQISDASWYVVCADATSFGTYFSSAHHILYELCSYYCGQSELAFDLCPWVADCCIPAGPEHDRFFADPSFSAQFTRHMGGSNVGFADGHAAWFNAEGFKANQQCVIDYTTGTCRVQPDQGKIRGVCPDC